MKRLVPFLSIIVIFVLTIPSSYAQRRKATCPAKVIAPDSATLAQQAEAITLAINNYQFNEAEQLLQAAIKQAERFKQPTAQFEADLLMVRRAETMLKAAAHIVVIDSFVVDRSAALQNIKLSRHSGQLLTLQQLNELTSSQSTIACSGYLNEFGDRLIYPSFNASHGTLQLAQADYVGGKWQQGHFLQGLPSEGYQQNYPFIMPDGITLYYAAQGYESLGGYDIFVSRYNRENKRYLIPENLGMPFNSPANDYLYAIDEVNQLGWFVSDRYQPADKVCVYVFVPFDSRELATDHIASEDSLRAYARLQSIGYAQSHNTIVVQGKQRLTTLLQQPITSSVDTQTGAFTFVLDDKRTYTSIHQFRSAKAREQAQLWHSTTEQIRAIQAQLNIWYNTIEPPRQRLLKAEEQLRLLIHKEQQLCKQIRVLERSL